MVESAAPAGPEPREPAQSLARLYFQSTLATSRTLRDARRGWPDRASSATLNVLLMAVSQPALKIGAAVFLSATALYGAALIYYNRHSFPTGTIGATYRFAVTEQAMRVERVLPGGPAARAGIGVGDLIVAVDGHPISGSYPVWNAVERGEPGEIVSLGVRRPGETEPRPVRVALDRFDLPSTINGSALTPVRLAALEILSFYPLPFLAVAALVLMQRPYDRHAWLLAVMLTSFIAGQRPLDLEPVIHPTTCHMFFVR
jgi:hypothetical protein